MNEVERMDLVKIDFERMDPDKVEYIFSSDFTPPAPRKKFVVISDEEALELYFPTPEGHTAIYCPSGAQRGDEGKGKGTRLIARLDSRVKWVESVVGTHNAGKGATTKNVNGEDARLSLNLLPATVVEPDICNYMRGNVKANPFTLEEEVHRLYNATGRTRLLTKKQVLAEDGDDLKYGYHLMLDLRACLVVPTNRVYDVVNKPDTMDSTLAGSTGSSMAMAGKFAPTVEDALFDHQTFKSYVATQINMLNDELQHDQQWQKLGITDLASLGRALKDAEIYTKDGRLSALQKKLSAQEIEFFAHEQPEQFLLDQFLRIFNGSYFHIGDTRAEIQRLKEKGYHGIVENVQSNILSNNFRFGPNRTSGMTDGLHALAAAGHGYYQTTAHQVHLFKFLNTSVGGRTKTMSGFIRQNALKELTARHPKTGETVALEMLATLQEFFPDREEARAAFQEVNRAFYQAIKDGYSLHNSTVYLKNLDLTTSLVNANALLTALIMGEKGETSGRARICRQEDLVETGVLYALEPEIVQVHNAVDRATLLSNIGLITAYEVRTAGGMYLPGTIIKPGMFLPKETLTNRHCVPVIDLLPSPSSVFADGTDEAAVGKVLHPDLSDYLNIRSDSRPIAAIGIAPQNSGVCCVKRISMERQ